MNSLGKRYPAHSCSWQTACQLKESNASCILQVSSSACQIRGLRECTARLSLTYIHEAASVETKQRADCYKVHCFMMIASSTHHSTHPSASRLAGTPLQSSLRSQTNQNIANASRRFWHIMDKGCAHVLSRHHLWMLAAGVQSSHSQP